MRVRSDEGFGECVLCHRQTSHADDGELGRHWTEFIVELAVHLPSRTGPSRTRALYWLRGDYQFSDFVRADAKALAGAGYEAHGDHFEQGRSRVRGARFSVVGWKALAARGLGAPAPAP